MSASPKKPDFELPVQPRWGPGDQEAGLPKKEGPWTPKEEGPPQGPPREQEVSKHEDYEDQAQI
jgi:hypothetical protein